MARWPSGYVMLNHIECDWVIGGSSPSLCNILYDNFWVLLPSPLPIPDPTSLPAPLGAPGSKWLLLEQAATISHGYWEIHDIWEIYILLIYFAIWSLMLSYT